MFISKFFTNPNSLNRPHILVIIFQLYVLIMTTIRMSILIVACQDKECQLNFHQHFTHFGKAAINGDQLAFLVSVHPLALIIIWLYNTRRYPFALKFLSEVLSSPEM